MAAAMPPAPRHPQLEGASAPGADAPHSLCASPADQQSHGQQQRAEQRSRTGRGTHAGEADGLTALHNRYWRSKHAKNGCRCCRPSRVGAAWEVRWRNAVVGIADRAANGTWRFTQHPGTHCPPARTPPHSAQPRLTAAPAGPGLRRQHDGHAAMVRSAAGSGGGEESHSARRRRGHGRQREASLAARAFSVVRRGAVDVNGA